MLNSKFHNSSAQGKNSTNIATLTTNQYIDIFLHRPKRKMGQISSW